jgi:hypothetical protein
MIGVRVREHDDVQVLAPPRAQRRQHGAFTGIDWAADDSPCVDQHQPPIGQVDQGSVALPDVERAHAQAALRRAVLAREHLRDAERHE